MLDCDHKGAATRYTATARRPGKTGSLKTILSNQGATSTSGHETGLRRGKSDVVFGHEPNTHCTLFSRAPIPAVHLDRFRWLSQIFSGQVYSENAPRGVMVYRAQVVDLLIMIFNIGASEERL
jgi:hypothetical protein